MHDDSVFVSYKEACAKRNCRKFIEEIEKEDLFNVVGVSKFPNSNSIKITLESRSKVLTVCQGGFYIFR